MHDGNGPPWSIALHCGLHFPGEPRAFTLVGSTDIIFTAAGPSQAIELYIELKKSLRCAHTSLGRHCAHSACCAAGRRRRCRHFLVLRDFLVLRGLPSTLPPLLAALASAGSVHGHSFMHSAVSTHASPRQSCAPRPQNKNTVLGTVTIVY